MSSSGYSSLILGVKLIFGPEEFEDSVERFDPKTGKPFQLKSPGFHIMAECINALGEKSSQFKLPKDDELFAEHKNKSMFSTPNLSSWNHERLISRTHDWMESLGFEFKDGCNDDEEEIICDRASSHLIVVGRSILSGSSYNEGLVSCELPSNIEEVRSLIGAKLNSTFINFNFSPELHLITECN